MYDYQPKKICIGQKHNPLIDFTVLALSYSVVCTYLITSSNSFVTLRLQYNSNLHALYVGITHNCSHLISIFLCPHVLRKGGLEIVSTECDVELILFTERNMPFNVNMFGLER